MLQDWSKPSRQSPALIGILLFRFLREAFAIVLVIVYSLLRKEEGKETGYPEMLSIIFLSFMLLRSLLEYWFFRFHIEGGNFIVKKGSAVKKTITLPLSSIQAVQIEQHVWHQLTGTAKLILDSPGTDTAEVTLAALPIQKAEQLKELILVEKKEATPAADKSTNKLVMALIPGDQIGIALTQNHLRNIALAGAFMLSIWNRLTDLLNIDQEAWLQEKSESVTRQNMLVPFLALTGIILVLSIGISVLKYAGLKVLQAAEGFDVHWGWLHRQQHLIPFRKIQLVKWSANFLRRWQGYAMVELKTTGKILRGEGQLTRIPTVSPWQTAALISCYWPELTDQRSPGHRIAGPYAIRKIGLTGLPLTIGTGLLLYFRLPELAWTAALILPVYGMYVWIYQQQYRYWITENGLIVKESVWGLRHTLIRWQKIQSIRVLRSLHQQRNGYADLELQTAGGRVSIPYMPLTVANRILDLALLKVESSSENWM